MRAQSTIIGLLVICLATAGCNSQGADTQAAGEDQGQFPDTTATEPNAILPSDDMPTGPSSTTATDPVAPSQAP